MIDRELAAFLEEGLIIHLGTRNARLEPSGARVAAVTVDEDGHHVTVYVPKVAAPRVLPDLEENGQAALVFVRPTDERSCQVKGVYVSSRAAPTRERNVVTTQRAKAGRNLEQVGFPTKLAEGWATWPSVAVRLRVTAVFDQTPGPGAGVQLR